MNKHSLQPVIPLIGDFSEQMQGLWLQQLSLAMPEFKVVFWDGLSEQEKSRVEVAVVTNIQPERIKQYPNLKWVQSLWAGVETLLPAIQDLNLKVVRMNDPQLAQSMSDSVLLWTLYLHQQAHVYRQQQNIALWQQSPTSLFTLLPHATRVGILGLGNLGKVAANRLKDNGFTVQGWSRTAKSLPGIPTYSGDTGLQQLLSTSDILVVLLPLTHSTRYLLNQQRLQMLPDGAAVINFARGAIIPEPDLLQCLNNGKLSHAVLDVFEQEPLPSNSPLWQHPNITVLPHISAQTNPVTASKVVAKNIKPYFQNGEIPEYIDVLKGY
ncbi:glyoxylate/hydroxypyruvate reductase A [Paraneptunicella aestuarii]|uniref:2-hydroxyacid dehydrogenase n=1 Tax=Paraneptunicella aestuarii TaxID=2831148 RepID=UPI001E3E07E6|nr:glyoxylate/hydroxypyruvate reductase A [Paraneptunicella aestuarii]UAA39577.1 glyoxylate/hydroxypyruvate reductase A [Paraneptunicella aestuarii]